MLWMGYGGIPLFPQQLHVPPADTLKPFELTEFGHQWADSGRFDSSTYYYEAASREYQHLIEAYDDSLLWVRYFNCQIWIGDNERYGGKYEATVERGRELLAKGMERFGEQHKIVARSCDLLGSTLSAQGHYEEAVQFHLRALRIRKALFGEAHEAVADSYNNLANVYRLQGRYQEAQRDYEHALEIRLKLFGEVNQSVAVSYNNLALVYTDLGEYEKALAQHEKTLEISQQVYAPNHPHIGSIYNNLAIQYFQLGQIDRAIEAQLSALNNKLTVYGTDHAEVASCYMNLGVFYSENGDYATCLEYLHRALDLLVRLLGPTHAYVATCYTNIGGIYQVVGNREKALTNQLKALEIKEHIHDPTHPDLANSYNNLSNIYVDKGDYQEALKYMNKTLQIQLKVYGEDNIEISDSYHNLALIAEKQGNYPLARTYALKALHIREQFVGGENPRVARSYNNLGTLHWREKELEEARIYIHKALTIRKKILPEAHPDIGQSYFNLGTLEKDEGNYEQAISYFNKAMEIYRNAFSERHTKVAMVYIDLAEIYALQGKDHQVLDTYSKALSANVEDFQPQGAFDLPPIESTVRNEINTLRILVSKSLYLQAHWDNPHYLAATDSTLQYAIHIIHDTRDSYQNEASQLALQELVIPVYEEAIQTCMERFSRTGEVQFLNRSYQYMEWSRAAILHQAIRSADSRKVLGIPDSILEAEQHIGLQQAYYEGELRTQREAGADSETLVQLREKLLIYQQAHDSLRTLLSLQYPDYYRLKYQNQIANIAEIQAALPNDNTLLVEYFWGSQYLYIMGLTQDYVSCHQVEIDEELLELLDQTRTLMADSRTVYQESAYTNQLYQFADNSHELYQRLLGPMLTRFPTIEQLIIVPDGSLNYVPFEVLVTDCPEAGTSFKQLPYLLNKLSVSYEYSGTLLSLNDKSVGNEYNSYGGFAPVYEDNPPEEVGAASFVKVRNLPHSWSGLKYNLAEIQGVSSLLEGDSFLASLATESSFKSHAHQYQILHLAMHAYTDDTKPQYSGLVFSPSADSMDDGVLHAYEIYNMSIPAELTVLSACRTGIGEWARGEGMMSLARAFKYAGCPSIVTSLWQANDPTTQELMELFFNHLSKGKSKSEALRLAKMDFVQNSTLIEAHPFHWATFILIGDPASIQKEPSSRLWFWGGMAMLFIGLMWVVRYRVRKQL